MNMHLHKDLVAHDWRDSLVIWVESDFGGTSICSNTQAGTGQRSIGGGDAAVTRLVGVDEEEAKI